MEEKLKELVKVTRRSLAQTKELFELCGQDFDRLYKVEMSLRQNFEHGCPNDVGEVERLLKIYNA